MLERLIAYHCAPALAGIKSANIVTCQKAVIPDAKMRIEKLNSELNPSGIFIDILCERGKRLLLIVYRRDKLTEHLHKKEVADFLFRYGYNPDNELSGYFNILKSRIKCDDFPHEIGAFLNYPISDIDAFINHRDEGCLLVGEWKVYSDAKSAKNIFSRYKSCRKSVLDKVDGGQTLAQIFCAA